MTIVYPNIVLLFHLIILRADSANYAAQRIAGGR